MIEVIEYYNQVISDWIKAYYADGTFLLLAIAAFIYLYVSCKELRYKFLLPVFLMLFITVNPVLYTYIFRRIIYWRLLWMLPTAILIAATVVVLLKRCNKLWMKWGLLLVTIAFIILQGEYIFTYGVFTPRSNWEKLSQETIDVCDIMLELDESPRVIVPVGLSTEIRQYAPEVKLMYGRETTGVYLRTPDWDMYAVYEALNKESIDYYYVLKNAAHWGFNFVVVNTNNPIEEIWLLEYGYSEVNRTAEYIIYYNSSVVDENMNG